MRWGIAAALLLALVACGERDADREAVTSDRAAPASPPTATVAPPPRPADTPPPAPAARASLPAAGTISYQGFGPAAFGSNEEQVRMAWGSELGGLKPEQAGGCYYLMPQPRSAGGYRVAFMFEDDRFVRMDVDADGVEAPGGGRVGMQAQDIQRLYAGRVQAQNHKYVEGGRYLRVPNASGPGVLLFETDATGRVSEWRIGIPPQVDYVEGCS